ncbi:MAG: HAD family hydrolase [Intrasporangium sp.]|uniref:HAD family hydrolase n=1 Tax=Intrasporangium sp. TaxID=1925024 RepID=UPI0026495D61|nr:HAD family hydrolase [Intrasporangium sp.]MDN5794198.1 HAD family hydrolase [Intrasporangium sp.]
MTGAPVRAVLFDWGGTITPWHEIDLRAQWTAFADGVGTLACARDDLAGRLYAAEALAWQRGRSLGVSARLPEILEACGLARGEALTEAGTAAYRSFWEPHTLTHPGVGPLWEALREAGLRVGVLSNTIWDRAYHRSIFERDGVIDLIDGDTYSSETPWVKPRAEIFTYAAREIGCAPEECVYVGDRSYEDVHGPQQVGMRAIWVPHSRIPVEQQVSHDASPDAVAHELTDVAAIVAAWNLARR